MWSNTIKGICMSKELVLLALGRAAEVWVGKHLIGMIAMISDMSYLYARMHPIHDLVTTNFTCLEKVQNKSNWYFWKCNHCGDADGPRGAQIQGHSSDNNLAKLPLERLLESSTSGLGCPKGSMHFPQQ
jgi:hypothetical protein